MSATDYEAYIFHVNRDDLLYSAIESANDIRHNLTVVDNSDDGTSYNPVPPIRLYRPSVPLSASQSFNFAMKETKAAGGKFILIMHEDAEAGQGTCLNLVKLARSLTQEGRKWGVIFTNYDCLAALNLDTLDDPKVGLWDTNLPQYFTDNTQYRKMRLAGYEMIESCLPVKHEPSQTIKSDPNRWFMNSQTFPLYRQYYIQCWGGEPGREIYQTPFNR